MNRILGGGEKQVIKKEKEKYLQDMSFILFGERNLRKKPI